MMIIHIRLKPANSMVWQKSSLEYTVSPQTSLGGFISNWTKSYTIAEERAQKLKKILLKHFYTEILKLKKIVARDQHANEKWQL